MKVIRTITLDENIVKKIQERNVNLSGTINELLRKYLGEDQEKPTSFTTAKEWDAKKPKPKCGKLGTSDNLACTKPKGHKQLHKHGAKVWK